MLLSGGGRTLENLAAATRSRELPAEVAVVISSHPEAFGLERARRLGLPHEAVDYRTAGEEFSDLVVSHLQAAEVDLVCMAGFIRYLRIPERWRGRVVNIHPSLLPAFGGPGLYGDRVHEAVLAAAERFSGCTVHYVDEVYDHGPIILQRMVPVLPGDTVATLRDRVFAEECLAYPEALRRIARGEVEVRGAMVIPRPPAPEQLPGMAAAGDGR